MRPLYPPLSLPSTGKGKAAFLKSFSKFGLELKELQHIEVHPGDIIKQSVSVKNIFVIVFFLNSLILNGDSGIEF